MFDKNTTKIEFANAAAYQFIIAKRPEAVQVGRQEELRSSESSEGYDPGERLQPKDLQRIYDTVKDLQLKRIIFNAASGVKTKVEVKFLEMVRNMKNRELQ